MYELGFKR